MKRIITISRELGSGGRTIGKMVANRMGIPYYDRELIDEAAKKSGLSATQIERYEQRVTNSFLYNLVMGNSYGYDVFQNTDNRAVPLTQQIYYAQQKVIEEYAREGKCVIVGRCADYILRDRNDVLRVFIYSDMEDRIKRGIEEYGMAEENIQDEMKHSDRERARHYNTFTDKKWGDRHNYDVMLNSGAFGYDGCADIICSMAEK